MNTVGIGASFSLAVSGWPSDCDPQFLLQKRAAAEKGCCRGYEASHGCKVKSLFGMGSIVIAG
jgi:hypothetical protein